jgi:hypothetical protein
MFVKAIRRVEIIQTNKKNRHFSGSHCPIAVIAASDPAVAR